jgi:methionine synthase II (cobalamin-independent)
MADTRFGCLATAIGSMPQTDPAAACAEVARYFKNLPAWPQLPNRTFRENMCAQFSEGFPGVVITGDKLYVDHNRELDNPLEILYAAYLDGNTDAYPTSAEYAAGLHHLLAQPDLAPMAIKGQVTGPVTWGLTVTDEGGKGIIYDDILGDAVAKFLRLKAAWQEKALRKLSARTIIFVDEPYMAAFGSSSMSLSKQQVILLLNEVLGGLTGLKGVHCCGNTDWSILLATKADILSFDAYGYSRSLSLYPFEVKSFLNRGGAIAWGIVPNTEEALAKETVPSLRDRLEEAMAPFTRNGIPIRQLVAQGLLTPSCGLAGLSADGASQTLNLLAELSSRIRRSYM